MPHDRAPLFETVVVGHQETGEGRDALLLGWVLAQLAGASLVIASVISPDLRVFGGGARSDRLADAKARLGSYLAEQLPGSPLTVESRALMADSPAEALARLAGSEPAQLIVVGSTHRGGLGRIVPGSVAQNLLRTAPCAVAVAPRGYGRRTSDRGSAKGGEEALLEQLRPRVISVGYDGSPEAGMALQTAAELGRRSEATLRVVAVIAPATPKGVSAHGAQAALGGGLGSSLQEALQGAVKTLPSELRTLPLCLPGNPAQVLLEKAGEGVDLLLMGSRGYGPLGRVIAGSVSQEVIDAAPCPVMITPRSAAGGVG